MQIVSVCTLDPENEFRMTFFDGAECQRTGCWSRLFVVLREPQDDTYLIGTVCLEPVIGCCPSTGLRMAFGDLGP